VIALVRRRLIVWVVVAALGLAILYPIALLLMKALAPNGVFSFDIIAAMFGSAEIQNAFINTVLMIVPSAIFAVLLATLFAWANARTDASLGLVGQLIPLASFAVPHIAVVVGWAVLGAPTVGFLKAPLDGVPILGDLVPSIFSLAGMIFVQTITMVPFAFLVLQPAFANVDSALEEASLSSGAGMGRTLFKVTLPATKHAIGGAFLLALIIGIGEYTVPLILGTPENRRTLSVIVAEYTTSTFPPKLGEASAIGLFLLLLTGTAWFIYRRIAAQGRFAQLGGKAVSRGLIRLGAFRWLIWAITFVYFLCATLLPLAALVIVGLQPYWTPAIDPAKFSLQNVNTAFNSKYVMESIGNSAVFAAVGSLVTVLLIVFLTSAAKIVKDKTAIIGLSLVKIPSAIASVVLALGILIAFFGPPFSLGNTALLLIGAYVVLFLPHASILGETATAQVRQDLIEASETSGASWFRTQWKVLSPLTAPAFIALIALVFSMMSSEVNASRIIAGPGTTVAGYTIIQVYQVGLIGQVAVLALFMAVLNFAVIGALTFVGRRIRRNW
jgi:iron(III) transport system permease protein